MGSRWSGTTATIPVPAAEHDQAGQGIPAAPCAWRRSTVTDSPSRGNRGGPPHGPPVPGTTGTGV